MSTTDRWAHARLASGAASARLPRRPLRALKPLVALRHRLLAEQAGKQMQRELLVGNGRLIDDNDFCPSRPSSSLRAFSSICWYSFRYRSRSSSSLMTVAPSSTFVARSSALSLATSALRVFSEHISCREGQPVEAHGSTGRPLDPQSADPHPWP